MPQILKNRCSFTLRLLLGLGNASLEQNLRPRTLGYLLFIPAIFFSPACWSWLPHGQLLAIIEKTVSLTRCWLLRSSYQSLARRWPGATQQRCIHAPSWVPSGVWAGSLTIWSQSVKSLSYSPQIAGNFLLRFAFSFSNMWKCPQYPNQE